jgi:putative phage-type endonuclease
MTDHIPQGSPEWFALRVGKVTASRMADLMAKTKTGFGASRANYMAELVAERLTGQPAERFTNSAMNWGTETEPQARAAYAFFRDMNVTETGFFNHPKIAMSGASPDGLVGDDGLLELKCPNTATHIESLLSGAVAEKYILQMLWQMACTGRKWCDFASFDPRLPPKLQLFVKRIPRDEKRIAELEDAVRAFLSELDGKLSALNALETEKAA